MGRRRRRTDGVPALPVVTTEQVVADRAAGMLARAWTLPALADGPRPAAIHAPLDPVAPQAAAPQAAAPQAAAPHRFPPSSQALVLEIAPGRIVRVDGAAVLGRRVADAPGRTAVLLDDPSRSVSREHAAIRPSGDGALVVEDLGSANGTTVLAASGAHEDSVAGRQVLARPGDTIMLGDYSLRVLPA